MTSLVVFSALLLLSSARTEEVDIPASLLGPQHLNHHAYDAEQYANELVPSSTRQGPILFPNDAPPPPRPPLVVTSRPLSESIARSELNPNPPDQNFTNSIAAQSQQSQVSFKPGFLSRIKNYKPFTYNPPNYEKYNLDFVTSAPHFATLSPQYGNPNNNPSLHYASPSPHYSSPSPYFATSSADYATPSPHYETQSYNYVTPAPLDFINNPVTGKPNSPAFDYGDSNNYKNPYADVGKNILKSLEKVQSLGDYQEQSTALPPIYEALSDHAQQNVQDVQSKNLQGYKVKEPDYTHQYHSNDQGDVAGASDFDQNSNYAFSYKVKDQKTGDDFSHSQQSIGSATNGEYRVRLPDGRMQIVSYTADENGYQADVRYDDEDKTAGNSIDSRHDYKVHDDSKYPHDYRNLNDYQRPHDYRSHDYYKNHNEYKHTQDYKHPHDYSNQQDYDQNQNFNNDYNAESPTYNRDYSSDVGRDFADNSYDNDRQYNTEYKTPNYSEYTDLSKEDEAGDYSLEYANKNDRNEPHTSKFAQYAQPKNLGVIVVPNKFISKSTVRPSYAELKPLFVQKKAYRKIPVQLNVPSTTPSSISFGSSTTEHVVVIGTKPNLYTNIRHSVAPATVTTPVPSYHGYSTPSNFLVSLAPLVKNVDFSGAKPVLSSSYIDRINKYLKF